MLRAHILSSRYENMAGSWKNKLEAKKKIVQEKFRREYSLLIDMPKQQTGNTNDGNTARKFFRKAEKQVSTLNLSSASESY